MRILAQEEYCPRCLLRVAQLGSRPVRVSDVAAAEGLNREYAGQLLQRLRRAGFLTGARGPGGGYQLARPAWEIALPAVIDHLDRPLWTEVSATATRGVESCCVRSTDCYVRALWRAVGQAITSVLSGLTLADFLQQERKTATLITLANATTQEAQCACN